MYRSWLIISLSLMVLVYVGLTWSQAKPWQRNYLGEIIDSSALPVAELPITWWVYINQPLQATLAAGIYQSQAACQQSIDNFYQAAKKINQEEDFQTWQISCQSKIQIDAQPEIHQVLDDYVKQVDDLLLKTASKHANAKLAQKKHSSQSGALNVTKTKEKKGKIKWVIIATHKKSFDKYFLDNLPWFDLPEQCQERLNQLIDNELAETGQQTFKDQYHLSCHQRLWLGED